MFNTSTQGISVRPSLLLDFTKSENIDPRLTITRNSIATRFNRNAVMETVSSGVARREYDPFDKRLLGLLVEPGRTNILRHSNNFSNASWTNVGATPVRTQNVAGLDGTLSAWTLDDQSTLADAAGLEQVNAITPSSTTSYCLSIWAKQGSAAYFDFYVFFTGVSTRGSYLRHVWSTNTTTVHSSDGGGATPLDFGKIEYPGGWYRFFFVVRDSTLGTNTSLQFRLYPAGRDVSFTGTTLFQRAQLEIGEYPTSYIPTDATAVQREEETARMTGSYLTELINPQMGTIYLDCVNHTRSVSLKYPRLASLVGNDANTDAVSIYTRTGVSEPAAGYPFGTVVAGNIASYDSNISSIFSGYRNNFRAALSYSKTKVVFASIGKSVESISSFNIPQISALRLLDQVRYQEKPSGIVKVFAYIPNTFTADELKVLTLP